MTTWNKMKISDIAEVIGGGTPSTGDSTYWGEEIPWLTPKDLSGYKKRYISKGSRSLSKLGLKNCSAKILPKGSILLTSRAPIGYLAIAEDNLCTNQGFKNLVLKEEYDSKFIYYLLKKNIDYIINMSSGSTFAEISGGQVKNLEFDIPDLETQQKIAKVLSAIDDKIELNNSINNNLEQQAQAIFKSWFVDFEPFGGTMPNDWTKRTLDEFCSIFTGRKNANQFEEDGENKFFTCGPNPLKINSYIYDGPAIIISGNGAYTGRTRFYNGKFDLYQRTYACTMLENIDSDYIYLLYIIIKNVLQDKIMGGTHGSAIPYIVMNDIAKFELFYNNEIFKDLSQIMKSIVNEIMHNELENEQLAQLRDTLLPKLMSGEIDVSNVEIDDILTNQSADKLLFSEDK